MGNDFLSDADKKLFRNTVGPVTPLKKAKQSQPKTACVTAIMAQSKQSNQPRPHSKPYLSSYIQENVQAESPLSWALTAMPRKRWREFQQGLIPFCARLDLHGLTHDSAQTAFLNFMEHAYHTQQRCVLIIHGKGGQQGEAPIIKNLVNRWLQQHPYTRAFHSAIARHGGLGAVYVLLKKWQKSE